ncbi:MAG: DUF669 domain-containing protein [Candidatus Eisenbacteria bacterium]
MPRLNFERKSEKRFEPLPEGKYLCQIEDIEEETTRRGDPMWRIRFVVTSGAHRYRWIFDRLVFSEAAKERLRMFCEAFGFETDGEVDLDTEAFLGKRVFLDVETSTYTDREGRERVGNEVAWAGFHRAVREDEGLPY